MQSKGYMCERCAFETADAVHHRKYLTEKNINDFNLSLSWNNLEALCHDCHNREHMREKVRRYEFDGGGNVYKTPPI